MCCQNTTFDFFGNCHLKKGEYVLIELSIFFLGGGGGGVGGGGG